MAARKVGKVGLFFHNISKPKALAQASKPINWSGGEWLVNILCVGMCDLVFGWARGRKGHVLYFFG